MTLHMNGSFQPESLVLSNQFYDESLDNTRKRYHLIDDDTRRKIVELVELHGSSLKEVSKKLGIKLSTCKAILQVFQKEGRFEKKKKRIRKNSSSIGKIVSRKIDSSHENKATTIKFKPLFSTPICKSNPFKLVPFRCSKKGFSSPKSKLKTPISHKSSMDEFSSDRETNCSGRNSFFKESKKLRKFRTRFNSLGTSPLHVDWDFSNEIEEENFGSVLQGMWRKVFEFFSDNR